MEVKKIVNSLIVASLLGFSLQASAMQLDGEAEAVSPIYKPTKSAVMKTMKKMDKEYTIDKDGDLEYTTVNDWSAYVVFNETGSGRLWNLQVVAQFSTKTSRYDELVAYSNKWNSEKKYPKVSMKDRDSLRVVLNYPVQYGFNPDEFEDNVIGMFERTLKTIGEETYAMRL